MSQRLFELPDTLVVKPRSKVDAQRPSSTSDPEILDHWAVQRDLEAIRDYLAGLTRSGATAITGEIKLWPGATAPDGWLFLTGGTYNAVDYPDLYAFLLAEGLIAAGATFTLMNAMDRFLMGANGGTVNVGTTGGANSVTLTGTEIPAHSHLIADTGGFVVEVENITTPAAGAVGFYRRGTTSSVLVTQDTGGGGAHENRPSFLGMNFIIKT